MRKTVIYICLMLAAAIVLPSCSAASSSADYVEDKKEAYYNPAQIQGGYYDADGIIRENEFIKTEKNAVYTFSADVDTASYT